MADSSTNSNTSNEVRFWQRDPTCADVSHDRKSAKAAKTVPTTETDSSNDKKLAAVVVRRDELWDNGSTIKYGFIGGDTTSTTKLRQRQKVVTTIAEWMQHANIVFEQTSDLNAAHIRIAFNSREGSWSYVGKDNLLFVGEATMNLGWVYGDTTVADDEERGVILHEFGHVLGLLHEHQSPVREDKITLRHDAVVDFYTSTQGWTEEDVEEQILDVYNQDEVSNYSQLDTTSIMMYFMPAAMNDQNIKIPVNNSLSLLDTAYITINYPPPSSAVGGRAKFIAALGNAGVPPNIQTELLSSFDNNDWGAIRSQFTSWCVQTRAAIQSGTSNSGPRPAAGINPGGQEPGYEVCGSQDDDSVPSNAATPNSVAHGVATLPGDMWDPAQTLTYSIAEGKGSSIPTPYQRRRVLDSFREIMLYANINITEAPFDEANPSMMIISFNTIPKETNVAGRCKIGKKMLNFGMTRTDEDKAKYGGHPLSCCQLDEEYCYPVQLTNANKDKNAWENSEKRIYVHEFCHALGLRHEHTSPYTKTVEKKSGSTYSAVTEYDEDSIMLYPNKELEVSGLKDQVMKKLNRNYTGYNCELSARDKAFLGAMYPRGPANPNDTFGADLKTLGLSAPVIVTLKTNRAAAFNGPQAQFSSAIRSIRGDIADQLLLMMANKPRGVNPGGQEPEFEACGSQVEGLVTKPGGVAHGVAAPASNMWSPAETITYSIAEGKGASIPTNYQRRRVSESFGEIMQYANINITEVPFDEANPSMMIISFHVLPVAADVQARCVVGKYMLNYGDTRTAEDKEIYGGHPLASCQLDERYCYPVPLTDADQDRVAREKREKRLYLHEFCHAIGLLHEHSSPYTKTVEKDTNLAYSVATEYDQDSIMLYPNKELEVSGLKDEVMKKLNRHHTTYNYKLSTRDKAFLGAMYPRGPTNSRDTFAADLKALGLSDASINNLKATRAEVFSLPPSQFRSAMDNLRDDISDHLIAMIKKKLGSVQPPKAARGAVAPPSKATSGSFLDQMVKTLSALFKPTSGQMFALQFPGRFLQQDLYAWDTTTAGIYGQFVKPTVVNESEFRLVDQLYNVGTVIGAPSGINLSIVYEQVLNNLIPGIAPSQINFSKQQDEIRKWLLKDVPTSGWVKDLIASQQASSTPSTSSSANPSRGAIANAAKAAQPSGTAFAAASSVFGVVSGSKPQFSVANKLSEDGKVNRMELAQALMHEYLAAKQAWELERDDMIKNAKGEDMDALTRRLAHITAIREAQLASKHADAVVRGYSHVIRQYMGYMDIKTPAEMLQDAKDALREASMSSLDGSMKIYPVQMMPIDWFQSLSTSFTMEDLTENPDMILIQIDNKSKQLDTLQTRLSVLQNKPKISIADLQNRIDSAQDAYDRAAADLSTTYTSNIISLAKTCINASGQFVVQDFNAAARTARIADAAITNIERDMKKLTDTQLAVIKASRAMSQLMAQKALAEATDTSQEVIETNVQIQAITRDIQELTTRLQELKYRPSSSPASQTPTTTPTLADIPMYPPESGSSGGSRWQEIYVNHEIGTKYTSSSSSSSAATRKTNVSLFFGSYNSDSSSANASANDLTQESALQVEVGFRATLVTVDRGGWFQPQFFKQSSGFHCIDKNLTWSKWPSSVDSLSDLSGLGDLNDAEAQAAFEALNRHLLPAFPVGFIICKDITIKIHMSSTDIASSADEMERHAASSTGVLCFSTSSSSSAKSSEKSYGFQRTADGCIIRIPGPQILGYIFQYTDPDLTTEVPDELPEGFLLSDAQYEAGFAAHSVNANSAKGAPEPTAQE